MKNFVAIILMLICVTGYAEGASSPTKYASLVINSKNGKILHQEFATYLRNPASLVKMMTLYITFDLLESGKLKLSDKLIISKNAASQPRTNLDLTPYTQITVREAIYGLIVHSANDAAVALAEKIAGSEKQFAQLMNIRAKNLNMTHTTFRNATGLTDKYQKSTALDMAKLAMALRAHFPQFYHLFSMKKFKFRGRTIESHNNVIKNYYWSDGLKTGYTQASGFNIVTSAKKGDVHLIGVVMGGESAKARDQKIVSLLNKHFKNFEKNAKNIQHNKYQESNNKKTKKTLS